MLKMFLSMTMGLLNLLFVPLMVLGGIFALFTFLVIVFIVWDMVVHKKRFKKGSKKHVKEHGFFRKLFVDAPRQYATDILNKEPDFFEYQGLIVYEGRQGWGKTVTVIKDTMKMQKEYPKCKVITNLEYTKEDDTLDHWTKLTDYTNGKHGVIAVMDEMQNWFSSNMSRNFPPEMLQTITQNRKNRRIILGTSQSFHLLAKAMRSQCTEVRSCMTFLGCVTIVKKRLPILDSEGNVKEWKNRGYYWYVHDKELRESYDTYKIIESLVKSGFQEIKPELTINNYSQIVNKK